VKTRLYASLNLLDVCIDLYVMYVLIYVYVMDIKL